MFKVEFLRFIKNPINWLFTFVQPIGILVLFGQFLTGDNFQVFQLYFAPIVLFTTVATTIVPISINVCLDKVGKRTKHYAIIPGAMPKYIGSLFLTNLIIAELTSLVLVLIGIFGYHVEVPTPNILMLIFAPPLSFILGFSIAIILAKYSKSLTVVLPLAMVTLFIVIFLSGMTIPLQFFAKDYFYYIQIWTPQGIIIMLYNHLLAISSTGVELKESILTTVQLVIASVVLCAYIITLITWTSIIIFKFKLI